MTHRRPTEEPSLASEDRLRHVLSATPAVIYALDVDGTEVRPSWVSDNVTRVLGYDTAEALVPGWWRDHLHPQDRERVLASTSELFAEGVRTLEYRFQHRDGSYRWILDEQRLLPGEHGVPNEIVGAWLEITERRDLQSHLAQARKMEAVGQLAGGVAHDFNNLLAAINVFAELVSDELPAGDRRRDDLGQIQEAVKKAATLTKQLLTLSRAQVFLQTVLDPNAVIADVEKLLHRVIGENIRLTTHLDPAAGLVKADAGQLEQVLLNLVVNARDAMPAGGSLRIATHGAQVSKTEALARGLGRPGRYVVIVVSDTGVGMDANTLARVFEPFFTTKGGEGTGLGLATAYGIVRQSLGNIAVTSEPGHGTSFSIYLPLVADAAHAAVAVASAKGPAGGWETILLAEDDRALRRGAAEVLKRQGYTVIAMASGEEALAASAEHAGPIHLLLTDVVMAGMDGRELSNRLLATRPATKVLFNSGYGEETLVRRGVREAGGAFLEKPFTSAVLARKVREVLDGT